ncbi:hypothetical protein ACVXG9_06005 [Escherichia coli]
MSNSLDRFRYFKQKGETFAHGHGQLLIPTVTGGWISPALAA